MRRFATGLLVAMVLLLAVSLLLEPRFAWLGFVRAFAEAATVGACADWFAVTALFRRPLGLPIPHTAIVPRNKDRIGEGLGAFIETNFLSPELVAQKLSSADIADRISGWMAHPRNADFVARRLAAAGPTLLRSLDDAQVQQFLRTVLTDQLRSLPAAPVAGRVLSVLIAGGHHQALIDACLDAARRFLDENRELMREKVRERTSWWVPKFLDERIFHALVNGVQGSLEGMSDRDNPWRVQLEEAVVQLIDRLQHDPGYLARGERLKQEFLDSAAMQTWLATVWGETRARILADLESPQSATRAWVAGALVALGQRLQADPALRAGLDRWITNFVLRQIVPHRREIGEFISGVVQRWDARTFVEKLEDQVGKDLQYIRINGTVVGGLVGLLIHALEIAVGW
jgi:uncharacterized membrane-anchored protein YjiN (DUF445 family)